MTKAIVLLLAILSPRPLLAQQASPGALPSAPGSAQDASGNYQVGGGVTAPTVIFAAEPEYSEAARKKKIKGNCMVGLVVDVTGHATQVHVVRSIAEGQAQNLQADARSLDEKALEAVRQYRFKAATLDGRPVPVTLTVAVNFQIF